ncbi:hypothetical protein GCM10027088_67600 [Nocardia goodfellowii]|uniref:Chitin-binding type-2 domain-containing protein n=1 Tax=Nocardia goodfellowii TaxID=882446 RepID=A0ABS4QQT6_9NOCA|nr:hypothetical protein [Nocardia goodfellowii]
MAEPQSISVYRKHAAALVLVVGVLGFSAATAVDSVAHAAPPTGACKKGGSAIDGRSIYMCDSGTGEWKLVRTCPEGRHPTPFKSGWTCRPD